MWPSLLSVYVVVLSESNTSEETLRYWNSRLQSYCFGQNLDIQNFAPQVCTICIGDIKYILGTNYLGVEGSTPSLFLSWNNAKNERTYTQINTTTCRKAFNYYYIKWCYTHTHTHTHTEREVSLTSQIHIKRSEIKLGFGEKVIIRKYEWMLKNSHT